MDATALAKANNTVNIHRLYSETELKQEREQAETIAKAKMLSAFSRLENDYRGRKAQQLLNINNNWAYPAQMNFLNFKNDDLAIYGMMTFHQQIESMWKDDEMLHMNMVNLRQETIAAAGLVENLLIGEIPEPGNYKMATHPDHPERAEWLESMKRERETLKSRGTWIMVPRSSTNGQRPVKCKYVYKKKRNKDMSLQYKSRLVSCGYSQVAGMDYSLDQLYAGVCSYSSMRFLMSLACQKGYILSQTDITGAYLESYLDETIYMEPPPDMFVNGKPPTDPKTGEPLVCLLKRGLYGLKQAGHAWSRVFKDFMVKDNGFKEMTGEPNMYRKVFELNGRREEIILGQYVDDCLIASSSENARRWFMSKLEKRFPVNPKSSGIISINTPGLVLSMHVRYDIDKGILQLDQHDAIAALAKRIGVTDSAPRSLPITDTTILPKLDKAEVSQTEYLSIVGSCLHICQVSRPDCAFAIGVLSRHSATPGNAHLEAAKDLVKYLYSTKSMCIQYTRNSSGGNDPIIYEKAELVERERTIEERLVASTPSAVPNTPDLFVDADFAGDRITRRSTSGMLVLMNGGAITWSSRLQKLCAQSSAESEIYAVTDCVKEALHIKLLCEECGIRQPGKPMTIWEDNNACIQLGHGLKGSKSAKHFETRLRFLNEHVTDKTIEFARINTKDQLADGFTKALPLAAF